MGILMQPRTSNQLKILKVTDIKREYEKLSKTYIDILNGEYFKCPKCNQWKKKSDYYKQKEYLSGYFPICKDCVNEMATDYNPVNKTYKDNKEKTINMLRMMNLPYIDSMYENALNGLDNNETYDTAWRRIIATLNSLQQFKNMTWKDSDFGKDLFDNEVGRKPKPETIKTFGRGFSNQELCYLEDQYNDWLSRYSCETKAQEVLFQRICFKQLELYNASKAGKDTSKLDKDLQDLMGALNVKPSQSNADSLTDSLSFGQLIQKWENERPISEPDEQFKDVDKIGLYIDVFFKGHLSKAMGLKTAFSSLYDKFMKRYTVDKRSEDDEEDSEVLFDKIFSKELDKEAAQNG